MDSTGWHLQRWDRLTCDALHAIYVLRQRVFVVEQRCAYLDADGHDPRAWHLWHDPGTGLDACARLFAPGVKYPEASVGRVVTAPEVRGTGLGRRLVAQSLLALESIAGEVPVRISAQAHLERFYKSFGFVTEGSAYMEDDIPHLAMVRPSGGVVTL
ncbi:MAG: GNAT family N-acetyltransferase [Deltaproteobacteria bacterium]|nr:GNAT family N-acetyltransferase [Deltaproteobacteria bacterium]